MSLSQEDLTERFYLVGFQIIFNWFLKIFTNISSHEELKKKLKRYIKKKDTENVSALFTQASQTRINAKKLCTWEPLPKPHEVGTCI